MSRRYCAELWRVSETQAWENHKRLRRRPNLRAAGWKRSSQPGDPLTPVHSCRLLPSASRSRETIIMKRLAVLEPAWVIALVVSAGLFASPAAADPVTDAANKQILAGQYAEAIASLDAAYKKNPGSSEYKKALAGAYFAQGKSTMADPQLPPMRKYPAALASLRKAVELDPQHAEAKASIKMIEDIYTSMGRPIPK